MNKYKKMISLYMQEEDYNIIKPDAYIYTGDLLSIGCEIDAIVLLAHTDQLSAPVAYKLLKITSIDKLCVCADYAAGTFDYYLNYEKKSYTEMRELFFEKKITVTHLFTEGFYSILNVQ